MLISYQDIEPETLNNLIESFILREGTDYGEIEFSLSEKTENVLQQLKEGSVVIQYSQLSESVTLIHKHQIEQQLNIN
jgi:uncharacterized protein YheU (UPF0270 family)